jgi:hypothetical protein
MTTLDDVLGVLSDAGWKTIARTPVNGKATNPTRVDLKKGRSTLPLLVYVWKVTGEGAGRKGLNYRIQTTRSHSGELLTETDRLTIGLGLDASRGVIAAFDGWTKRATGGSSSVHIKRALLDEAAASGFSLQGPYWDDRAAASFASAGNLVDWMLAQDGTRTAGVQPLSSTVDGEKMVALADLWDSAPAAWLRVSDNLVLVEGNGKELIDNGVWRIDEVAVSETTPPGSRYPRRSVEFKGHRHGYVKNEATVLDGLKGRLPK